MKCVTNMSKLLLIITFMFSMSQVLAKPGFPSVIPNGSENGCLNCHKFGPGSERNQFGQDFAENGFAWEGLFDIDSDGDGFTNGQELQDPDGLWVEGEEIGDPELVTLPGDDSDFPTSIKDASRYINFTNIFPNPATHTINLELFVKSSGNMEVVLLDMQGREVASLFNAYVVMLSQKNLSFNLSGLNLASGRYYLGIYINDAASFKPINIYN